MVRNESESRSSKGHRSTSSFIILFGLFIKANKNV
jgi:hypothetical protein